MKLEVELKYELEEASVPFPAGISVGVLEVGGALAAGVPPLIMWTPIASGNLLVAT